MARLHTGSARARRFARTNALGAITASITGNATYHALAAGVIEMVWPIVAIVGSAPGAALGLLAHLAVLRTQPEPTDQDRPCTEQQQSQSREPADTLGQDEAYGLARERLVPARDDGPTPQDEECTTEEDSGLLGRARAADGEHRDRTGHAITRDALLRELGIGTSKASALLRELREAEEDSLYG